MFTFGFKRVTTKESSSNDETSDLVVPNHLPSLEEASCLGLGRAEYTGVIRNGGEVSDPLPSKKQKVVSGKYRVCSPEE